MFLPVTQPNVIVLVLPQNCSFTYEQCCNTARLHTSSVFPSKLKLNTDPEAEPYGIHVNVSVKIVGFRVCQRFQTYQKLKFEGNTRIYFVKHLTFFIENV